MMNAGISIRPSKDLRNNYAQISLLSRAHPVAITVNGKEDTVVMSHDDFINRENHVSELEARLMVYDHLAQAADDVKLGRAQELDKAFDDILMELEQV
jgi:PHD/YefM family antitoxin component YafN of YafNO toxin-antitoxin module